MEDSSHDCVSLVNSIFGKHISVTVTPVNRYKLKHSVNIMTVLDKESYVSLNLLCH